MPEKLANAHETRVANGWALYGATGVTGGLILAAALARGLRPLLIGRDAMRLAALAEPHGLAFSVARLEDAASLADALAGRRLLLNAAGPFAATGGPLIAAALAAGCDYLDIGGELAALAALLGMDAAAKARGVALVGGAGFGIAASDGLAVQLVRRLGGADRLRIAVAVDSGHATPGVADSTLAVIAGGGRELTATGIVPARLARQRWRVAGPDGAIIDFASAPLADLAGIARCLPGTPAIAGVPMPTAQARITEGIAPLLPLLLKLPPVRRAMANTGGHAGGTGRDHVSRLWIEAAHGTRHGHARLDAGEGFAASAQIAVAAVAAALARRPASGAHTPASAFGAEFITGVPGITLNFDLPS